MATTAEVLSEIAVQFELDAREAYDRVRDHMDANNQTGAALAAATSETLDDVVERLRARALEG